MLELTVKALETVISSGVEKGKHYEAFCEELEKSGVNENEYDYCELFEEALIEKGLI